jgi:hypothetical protein
LITYTLQWQVDVSLLKILDFDGVSVVSQGRSNNLAAMKFKDAVKSAYDQRPPLKQPSWFDMATGRHFRHIEASHIFQYRWRKYMRNFSSIEDINNGLRLYKPVHWAFNRAKLCIEIKGGDFKFRLLDPSLKTIKLTHKADEIHERARNDDEDFSTTFGDLDGKRVFFPPACSMRPSKRLLSLHAYASWLWACHLSPNSKTSPPSWNISDLSGDELTESTIGVIQEEWVQDNEWRDSE